MFFRLIALQMKYHIIYRIGHGNTCLVYSMCMCNVIYICIIIYLYTVYIYIYMHVMLPARELCGFEMWIPSSRPQQQLFRLNPWVDHHFSISFRWKGTMKGAKLPPQTDPFGEGLAVHCLNLQKLLSMVFLGYHSHSVLWHAHTCTIYLYYIGM